MAGIRDTKQRRALVQALNVSPDFLSAQEIHQQLQRDGNAVGLATVYRNLAAMVESGELDVVLREDGESVYRKCGTSHHHHIVCRNCGRTVEVSGDEFEEWLAATATDHGFTQVEHRVELFGLCPACS